LSESRTPKRLHEIRDPIHIFIKLDTQERAILDSRPVQRLRHIHQLAMTYLVYPGATHKRFEHSLGVMELASRVYDVVTHSDNLTADVRQFLGTDLDDDARRYWRRVLRLAALLHDIGHLPFSHASEDLLPRGEDHETITAALIQEAEIAGILGGMTPPILPLQVARLSIKPGKLDGSPLSAWERILNEIIVGDGFGVDRMDYLLRDSHHAGVAYGRFDYFRLIETMRILPQRDERDHPIEPALGIEEGGLQSAEALILARYFMYSQVYFHSVRRIYDIHLRDFLEAWLPRGRFSTTPNDHLALSDNEVAAAIEIAARSPSALGHDAARRIVTRQHFRRVYARDRVDLDVNPAAPTSIGNALRAHFGAEAVRSAAIDPAERALSFPVRMRDDSIRRSTSLSESLAQTPSAAFAYVFVEPGIREAAVDWLSRNKFEILTRGRGDG
jgi:HD superfamily phosphohydrolase